MENYHDTVRKIGGVMEIKKDAKKKFKIFFFPQINKIKKKMSEKQEKELNENKNKNINEKMEEINKEKIS